jgi:hypothetical protein
MEDLCPAYEGSEPPDPRRLCMVRAEPGKSERLGLILEWRSTNANLWAARVICVPNPNRTESWEDWFARELVRVIDPSEASPAAQSVARYNAAGGTTY